MINKEIYEYKNKESKQHSKCVEFISSIFPIEKDNSIKFRNLVFIFSTFYRVLQETKKLPPLYVLDINILEYAKLLQNIPTNIRDFLLLKNSPNLMLPYIDHPDDFLKAMNFLMQIPKPSSSYTFLTHLIKKLKSFTYLMII